MNIQLHAARKSSIVQNRKMNKFNEDIVGICSGYSFKHCFYLHCDLWRTLNAKLNEFCTWLVFFPVTRLSNVFVCVRLFICICVYAMAHSTVDGRHISWPSKHEYIYIYLFIYTNRYHALNWICREWERNKIIINRNAVSFEFIGHTFFNICVLIESKSTK